MIPRPYQLTCGTAIDESLLEHQCVIVVMATGCHAYGQGILMADGSVRQVQDIRVGDFLMGPDSMPRCVMRLERGHGEMRRICPIKGRDFVVNHDHKLTLVRTKKRKCDLLEGTTTDVPVCEWESWSNTKKHIHKLFRVGVDFPFRQNLQLDPYMMGLLLADGSVVRNVSLTTADAECATSFKDMAHSFGLSCREEQQDGNSSATYYAHTYQGNRSGNPIILFLRILGLYGKKCDTKFIPHKYKVASRGDRWSLLAGLIDGDGTPSSSCGYDYISKSFRLSEDVCFVARSLGLAAYSRPCEKKSQNGTWGVYYRVNISGDVHQIPCRVPRKQTFYCNSGLRKKNILRTGFSVEYAPHQNYYGFTLAGPDGRYLLDDFTVTHNTGKTVVFAHEIRKHVTRGRVMVVAHREELLTQASDKIQRICGITPGIEMAEYWADDPNHGGRPAVLVASVQTLNSGMGGDGRVSRFRPDEFSLLIIDEAHHAPAPTYRKVIDHFTQNDKCKVLGFTATPDRLDEKAMGQIFTDCAYDYDVGEAISDGWLVPIMANQINVHGLDFSGVRTTAGELNGADLNEVMNDEAILHEIAAPTIDISNGRQTLVFATSCANAERLCEIFNRHRAGSARYVDGKTDKDIRRSMLEDYQQRRFSILCNVGVATEGFDVPGIEVVVPRPTKSRCLFAQMCGRGTRPIDGLVDQYGTAEERRAAIASSTKPALEVLDFCGVTGRHKLVHTADVLGGRCDDDVVERATRLIDEEDGGMDVETALERARREHEQAEAARAAQERRQLSQETRKHIKGRARYTLSKVDMFDMLDVAPMRLREWDVGKTLSEKQAAWLRNNKVDPSEMNYSEARAVLNQLGRRMKLNVATVPMQKLLQKHGWWTEDLNYDEAHRRINAIKENGWRKPREAVHA